MRVSTQQEHTSAQQKCPSKTKRYLLSRKTRCRTKASFYEVVLVCFARSVYFWIKNTAEAFKYLPAVRCSRCLRAHTNEVSDGIDQSKYDFSISTSVHAALKVFQQILSILFGCFHAGKCATLSCDRGHLVTYSLLTSSPTASQKTYDKSMNLCFKSKIWPLKSWLQSGDTVVFAYYSKAVLNYTMSYILMFCLRKSK